MKETAPSKEIKQHKAPLNTEPVYMDLSGEAGERVFMAALERVLKRHEKEFKALADK